MPHLGCPHDCVFCNQKRITGQEVALDLETIKKTVDAHLEDIQSRHEERVVEIAFFGGSFTGIPIPTMTAYLALAYTYKQAGLIDGIRLSTRPDYIDANILSILTAYGVTTIELGVQSLDFDVLLQSKRGHTVEVVSESCRLIKESGIELGLQMMIGLPSDDVHKMMYTAKLIRENEPSFVRIYPTLVIRDTELEELYTQGLYTPLTLKEAVHQTAQLYQFFKQEKITVIRMGLQPTEDLENGALVAGPFHPAFRQLVESYLYLIVIDEQLQRIANVDRLSIYVPQKQISNVVGQKRENLVHLEQKYELKKIKVYGKNLPDDVYELDVDGVIYRGKN